MFCETHAQFGINTCHLFLKKIRFRVHFSVADLGFSIPGRQLQGGGGTYHLVSFRRKLHEKEEIWAGWPSPAPSQVRQCFTLV